MDATTFLPIHEHRKPFTDNALMALENVCNTFSARGQNSELGIKSQWQGLFEEMVMEMKQGASITANMTVCGRTETRV